MAYRTIHGADKGKTAGQGNKRKAAGQSRAGELEGVKNELLPMYTELIRTNLHCWEGSY